MKYITLILSMSFAALLFMGATNVRLEDGSAQGILGQMPTGFSYLTTGSCASGYSAVEDGYIKLGASPNTTATGANTRDISHTHSTPNHAHRWGQLTGGTDGKNLLTWNVGGSHAAVAMEYTDANYVGGGNRLSRAGEASGTNFYTESGASGTSGTGGSATQNIEPRNITMRLCVKT